MKSIILAGVVIIIIVIAVIFLLKGKSNKASGEKFTNASGYYTKPNDCDSMTLKDCLECSTCAWCMRNDFAPKCVAGNASDLIKSGQCKKVYANDTWTRSVMAGDNNYREAIDLPLFD